MNRIHITLDMAIAAMLAIVADKGYTHIAGEGNSGCVYGRHHENGFITPVCIVGEYFARLGLLRALVSGYEGWESACSTGSQMWDTLEEYGVTVDHDARAFLYDVQTTQDSPRPWGEAVTGAIERLQVAQESRVREAQAALEEAQEREAFLLNKTAVLDNLRPTPVSLVKEAPLADWERELLDSNPWDAPF